jgi:uncharacterized protein YndB with AHSA1/START domain
MMQLVERTAPDTLRIERMLDAPVETVWRWLVEPELRALWFAGGETELREGGALNLVFDHDNLSSDDVPYPPDYAAHKCAVGHERIVTLEAPRRFAFTWSEGKEGTASFELFDAGGGRTRLVLTHSGITGPAPMLSFAGGWTSHLTVLQEKLAGRDVRNFWALHERSTEQVKEALGANA